jgi:hypothetical protein
MAGVKASACEAESVFHPAGVASFGDELFHAGSGVVTGCPRAKQAAEEDLDFERFGQRNFSRG